MTIALIFLAGIMATIIWWLARQTVNVRPWEETRAVATSGEIAEALRLGEPGSLFMPAKKVGLGLFLCVATSLFALTLSAFFMRKGMSDWAHLSLPALMWLNTGVLLSSCVIVHHTRRVIRRGRHRGVKSGLLWGGLLTVLFLTGQLVAWRQLNTAGLTATANPANAFFYLFTALHGLHLLGGLWVWARATIGAWFNLEKKHLALRIELCTVYWDYLLLVWLVLFVVLLTG